MIPRTTQDLLRPVSRWLLKPFLRHERGHVVVDELPILRPVSPDASHPGQAPAHSAGPVWPSFDAGVFSAYGLSFVVQHDGFTWIGGQGTEP